MINTPKPTASVMTNTSKAGVWSFFMYPQPLQIAYPLLNTSAMTNSAKP